MGWSRFHYWRRGKSVPKVIRKKPESFKGPLVEYQIKKGMYRPSPYLQIIEQEKRMLADEISEYKKNNPGYDKIDFLQWKRERRAVYNKRIFKLFEEHWIHDEKRMKMFRNQLLKDFKVDVWEQCLEECTGDEMEFYKMYRQMVNKNTVKSLL